MDKKFLIASGVVIIAGISYWLISPAYRVVEKQDTSPIAESTPTPVAESPTPPIVKDDLETMDAATKVQMNLQIEAMKDKPMVKEMPAPAATVVAQGALQPRAHDVTGKVLLIEDNGKQILRFEDFESINGPDLRIYLSSDLGIEDSVDLGPILATKGSVNYTLSENIDVSKYRYALVWCRAFRVLFSYAEIK